MELRWTSRTDRMQAGYLATACQHDGELNESIWRLQRELRRAAVGGEALDAAAHASDVERGGVRASAGLPSDDVMTIPLSMPSPE